LKSAGEVGAGPGRMGRQAGGSTHLTPLSHRIVTTTDPSGAASAILMAAQTFIPAEPPTRMPWVCAKAWQVEKDSSSVIVMLSSTTLKSMLPAADQIQQHNAAST
jgi:hypothetical protein